MSELENQWISQYARERNKRNTTWMLWDVIRMWTFILAVLSSFYLELFYLPPMLTNSLSGFALFNTHLKYVCSPIHAHTHMITHMDTYAHTHRGHLSFPCSETFLYAPQLPGHNLVTASAFACPAISTPPGSSGHSKTFWSNEYKIK